MTVVVDKGRVESLSIRDLTAHKTLVLGKGLNFAVTLGKLPTVELITTTESAIKQAGLTRLQAEELRHEVGSTLIKSFLSRQNINREERAALEGL